MLDLLLLPAFYVFATLLSLLCDRLAVWWNVERIRPSPTSQDHE